jgi:hypothetical protein
LSRWVVALYAEEKPLGETCLKMMRIIGVALLMVATLLPAMPAVAAEPTLSVVKKRGKLLCGVNGQLPGFSAQNAQKAWAGFEIVTDALVVDLVTVTSYQVNGRQVLVPQRIEPDRYVTERTQDRRPVGPISPQAGNTTEGSTGFREAITTAPTEYHQALRQLADWADELQSQDVRLQTYWGRRGEVTLLPKLRQDDAGLVTIWNWGGAPLLSFWRSVFERRAPGAIREIERLIAPTRLGQGNTTTEISAELLSAIRSAYLEATSD